ncbi:hypothetical protein D5018_09120 [Parashewanella curva]|uniref:Uncharacterized protein n=1 Tax=Parashewanella curva TaxID=2338552 RepID=A0A3L8PZJ7_9GAMM|nr:hypothetical protein [Parashewanella curva]RLV59958.1 hypothetical protein D5018_09120 [Parashewanella curva]
MDIYYDSLAVEPLRRPCPAGLPAAIFRYWLEKHSNPTWEYFFALFDRYWQQVGKKREDEILLLILVNAKKYLAQSESKFL